jgi:cell division protein FtsZ
LARTAAEEELPALRALCQGYSLVFILAGLGGGSGTGIAPVVARVAREAGASVFGFVTAPFECEGTRRQQQALVGLHRLKTVADGVLCLPNEKMLLMTDDRTTLLQAFRASSEHIRDAVTCIWNLLTRPGLLNVSFADICAVLRGPNLESAFARVEVEGADRAEEALRLLMAHPLLARGETLRRAESLLVSFSAGSNLGMGETRRIMEELNRRSDGARVVVGASVDENGGDRLTVTLVASSRQLVLHEPTEEAADARMASSVAATPEAEGASEDGPARTARRMAPLPPELTPELTDQLMSRTATRAKGGRRKPQQVPLPFEIITKGRFEKCEPTIRRGHNLDQPTFLRRGVTLN